MIMRICPLCGEEYWEPPAISRVDDKTEIYSSCGIREAVGGLLPEGRVEEIVKKTHEMYAEVNGCG